MSFSGDLAFRHLISTDRRGLGRHFRDEVALQLADVGLYSGVFIGCMLDWTQCSVAERVPGKVSGVWVFKGARVPVRALFENLEGGRSRGAVSRMVSRCEP